MVRVVIDTSVLIEYTRTGRGQLLSLVNQLESGNIELIIPTVVIFELWAGVSMNRPEVEAAANNLISAFIPCELSTKIAQLGAQLQRHWGILDFDAIIAATAQLEQAQVATLNAKDFLKVPGLVLWQPSSSASSPSL